MISNLKFDIIYDEYHPKILCYLSRIVGRVDAEDLTQEVFDKINRGLEGFQGRSDLSAWIYRIATNTAIDRFRSVAYKNESTQDAFEDEASHQSSVPTAAQITPVTDQLVIRKEMSDCVNEFIDNLPPIIGPLSFSANW